MADSGALIVYKASAGSGKTYTLTREYIGLLLRGWYAGEGCKHDRILAATFTNKATIELRERIMRELLRIRDGVEDNLGAQILTGMREEGEISDEEYMSRRRDLPDVARALIRHILEDYGAFRVQTIDSFFQEVVRSFALELSSLSGTYNIELDDSEFITLSIDQLFVRLGDEGKQGIFDVLAGIYESDAESGEEKTDIRRLLITLTKKFLDNKSDIDPMEEGDYSQENIHRIRTRLQGVIEESRRSVEEKRAFFVQQLEYVRDDYALDYNASLRQTLAGVYKKLSDAKRFQALYLNSDPGPHALVTKTLVDIVEDETALFHKKSLKSGDPVYDSYARAGESLRYILKALIEYEMKTLPAIRRLRNTAELILKYIYLMPALIEAKKAVEEYQKEQNVVLISRIDTLLRDIIGGADVPFIYDKMGAKIEHFMIDEFQDTSRVQWDNFLPLLLESLSYGHRNYLVGDVKQSIYRFRGTDSSLLGTEVERRMPGVDVHALGINWRSHGEIVRFNNTFFDSIYDCYERFKSDIIPLEEHAMVYRHDLTQQPKHHEGGYVELNFVQKEGQTSNHIEQEIRPRIVELVRELQDDYGYRRRDIAILVRDNKEADRVAGWFSQAASDYPEHADKYHFISDEALKVSGSRTVLLLAQFISYIANNRSEQKDTELRIYLQMFLARYSSSTPTDSIMSRLIELSERGLGLYETVTEVITSIIDVPISEMLYVSAFMDHLFAFTSKHTGTPQLFEEWWSRHRNQLRVEMGSVTRDSITIITIHKSKGLEYPVVIMPGADWDFSKKSGDRIDFFATNERLEAEFGFGLSGYYVDASPSEKRVNTYFEEQYLRSKEADYMDSLNLLYVAFTRAAEHLYVYAGTSKNLKIPTNNVGHFLRLRAIELYGDKETYTFGTRAASSRTSSPSPNAHILTSLTASPAYEHLRFTSDRYTSGEMMEGTALHRILEHTRTRADFAHAVEQALRGHAIDRSLADKITESFEIIMSTQPMVASWFTPHDDSIILSETSISEHPDLPLHRPDRMIYTPSDHTITIVDYKFGAHRPAYIRQIKNYAQALRRMGYHTEGYLWYNLSADPTDLIHIPND